MAGATAGAADLAAYRQRLWSAIAAESAKALEGGLLEVVVAELQAGRSAGFRRVLLQALDGSSVAQNSRTSDLLQRFAEDARGGSAEAAVLLGALLCFHAMFNSEARARAPPPRALLSPCCPAVRPCLVCVPGTGAIGTWWSWYAGHPSKELACAATRSVTAAHLGIALTAQEMQDLAGQGFKYLEAVAMRGNKLGLLLYGLAAEAGRGTPRDHLRAHQAR
jgi:hypothetical protein